MINNIYFSNIDIVIFLILIIGNIIVFKFRDKELGCLLELVIALLYTVILPLISQTIEINHVVAINGLDDSFTLLYTFFRFPIYWSLGFIQLIIFTIFYKDKKLIKNR